MSPERGVIPSPAVLEPQQRALRYASFLYKPLVRRVLFRGALTWFVIRAVLEGFSARLEVPGLALPAAAGVIAFVLVIEQLHARAMREVVFRADAGIGTPALLVPLALLLVGLETLFRVVDPLAALLGAALLRLWR